MPTLIDRFFGRILERLVKNKFNEAFYKTVGTNYTAYDENSETYLEQGFLYNPLVYSICRQKAEKAKQIPFYIKKVKDEKAKKKLDFLNQSTKHVLSNQLIKALELKNQAYDDDILDFPLPKPNELQTWSDIVGLYQTFMDVTGNFYLYCLKGDFSKEPLAVYVLPSHLMQIVLKPNASILGVESPISHYILIEGDRYVKFEAESVIHIKTPNPEYGLNGEHLYGLSPLRAALRNIQSSNLGLDLNNDTMLNGGAFGFIHGMEIPLTDQQAKSVNSRLKEMRASKDVLGKIQGLSAKLGFTQIRLSASEMELFKYFDFDEKMIANALGWSNVLLNSETKGDYGGTISAEERRVVSNSIMPSLQLLDETLTDRLLPMFKGYENTVLEHDPSDLPEMQEDMKQLVDWLSVATADGAINRNTYREYLRLPPIESDEMNAHTVKDDVIPLAEAIQEDFRLNEPQNIQE